MVNHSELQELSHRLLAFAKKASKDSGRKSRSGCQGRIRVDLEEGSLEDEGLTTCWRCGWPTPLNDSKCWNCDYDRGLQPRGRFFEDEVYSIDTIRSSSRSYGPRKRHSPSNPLSGALGGLLVMAAAWRALITHSTPDHNADPHEMLSATEPPFSVVLLRLIDRKGLDDATVYNRAQLDRRLFSKMRNPRYQPSKRTALALCIGCELTVEEAKVLLHSAGFSLTRSSDTDVVLEFCLENHVYDLDDVNELLYYMGLKCL